MRRIASVAVQARVLIYKRTHVGDPTREGAFGLADCMGSVRRWNYDAVIGVGGLSAEPQDCGIAGRITWVGVGAKRSGDIPVGYRGPIVEFDQFKLFDEAGPMLDSVAPNLALHMFGVHRRVIMSDSLHDTMQREITKILALASGSSCGRGNTVAQKIKCPPKPKTARICPPKRAKPGVCVPRLRLRPC
jgi:hypothetical protein